MAPASSPSDSSRAASLRARLNAAWRNRAVTMKAASFALIGAVNTVLDYCVFLLARAAYGHSPAALALFDWVSNSCRCGSPAAVHLIAANMTSWLVAMTSSYIMNSSITFAAVFGIAGLIANTATLVVAAQILLLPVWIAKGIAVMASFVVNFSLSHFVVFRVRAEP
jgi:putative flippase GtrA